jgi:hypothetical protein
VPAPHVLPTPPADLPPVGSALAPNAVAGYRDGLYVATTDDAFRLRVFGVLVAAWQLDRSQVATDNKTLEEFSLPTARLGVRGHAFVTTDFALSFDDGSAPVGAQTGLLRDAYVDRPVLGARLRFGRFKPMFARQAMTPITDLELPERAITALWPYAAIDSDRELGVTLYGHDVTPAAAHGVEWSVGAFQGRGTPIEGASPVVTARVGWSSAHANAYSEADFDGGPLRIAVAVGYAADLAHGRPHDMVHTVTADAVIKLYGLALSGAVFIDSVRIAPPDDRQSYLRGYAQLGYMMIPRKFELVARYAHVPTDTPSRQEVLGGVDIFMAGHDEKWQLAAGREYGARQNSDWIIRLQTQLAF